MAEVQAGALYLTWCDDLQEQTVECNPTPTAAILTARHWGEAHHVAREGESDDDEDDAVC